MAGIEGSDSTGEDNSVVGASYHPDQIVSSVSLFAFSECTLQSSIVPGSFCLAFV